MDNIQELTMEQTAQLAELTGMTKAPARAYIELWRASSKQLRLTLYAIVCHNVKEYILEITYRVYDTKMNEHERGRLLRESYFEIMLSLLAPDAVPVAQSGDAVPVVPAADAVPVQLPMFADAVPNAQSNPLPRAAMPCPMPLLPMLPAPVRAGLLPAPVPSTEPDQAQPERPPLPANMLLFRIIEAITPSAEYRFVAEKSALGYSIKRVPRSFVA